MGYKTNIQTSFITTCLKISLEAFWTSERFLQHAVRECVTIHMKINVDLLVIRAMWDVDSRLFVTNGGL